MQREELKVGLKVINSMKIVGIITNICEKENTVTIMWSDGSFSEYPYGAFEHCSVDVIGMDENEVLSILLDTLQRIERLHNE